MELPNWALQEETYQPDRDRDAFLSRSLLRILAVVLSLRAQGRGQTKKRHAGAALLFLFFWLLLTVTAQNTLVLLTELAVTLVYLVFCDGRTIRRVLATGCAAALFSLLLVLPALFFGSGVRVLLLPVKTFLTMCAGSILAERYAWHALTAALAAAHLPQIAIFLLDTTLRSILLLGEQAEQMLTALKLRSVGHNHRKGRAVSGVLGALFLRSRAMSEEMAEAMTCRCFTGTYGRQKREEAEHAGF